MITSIPNINQWQGLVLELLVMIPYNIYITYINANGVKTRVLHEHELHLTQLVTHVPKCSNNISFGPILYKCPTIIWKSISSTIEPFLWSRLSTELWITDEAYPHELFSRSSVAASLGLQKNQFQHHSTTCWHQNLWSAVLLFHKPNHLFATKIYKTLLTYWSKSMSKNLY